MKTVFWYFFHAFSANTRSIDSRLHSARALLLLLPAFCLLLARGAMRLSWQPPFSMRKVWPAAVGRWCQPSCSTWARRNDGTVLRCAAGLAGLVAGGAAACSTTAEAKEAGALQPGDDCVIICEVRRHSASIDLRPPPPPASFAQESLRRRSGRIAAGAAGAAVAAAAAADAATGRLPRWQRNGHRPNGATPRRHCRASG